MTAERWRHVNSGPLTGAENMALDAAMLEAHAAGEVPPTLRVYAWRPAAVSLGRFQRVEGNLDLDACRRLGVDVVRRPTGGRAILHTSEEVTFSVVVSEKRLQARGVMACYRRLAEGIVAGLRSLGLDARLVERTRPAKRAAMGPDPACFAVKARCDLVVGSSKLVGSAQVHREGFVLQQNSLPLALNLNDWSEVFLRPPATPEAVGLWDAAGRHIGPTDVAAALQRGFGSALGVRLEEADLSPKERDRSRELAPEVAILA